jgi:hypothetical protein
MEAGEPEKSWSSTGSANDMQTQDDTARAHGVALDANQAGNQATDEVTEKKADIAPDGGYGWVCVAACATINGHTWGLNSGTQDTHRNHVAAVY